MKGGYNNERKSLVPLVFCGVSYSCKRLGFLSSCNDSQQVHLVLK